MDEKELYDRYAVELAFRGRVYGGIPLSERVMTDWLVNRAKMSREEAKEKAAQIA